ncbi:AMP-binding protein [Luteipulveratus halotolerans]|nr:AMP-binding protein [Luteipulveratus halotolerans]
MTWLVDARGGWSRRDLLREARRAASGIDRTTTVLVATTSLHDTIVTTCAALHVGAPVWLVGARRGRLDLVDLMAEAGPGALLVTDGDLGVAGERRLADLVTGRRTPLPRVPAPVTLHTSGTTGRPRAVRRSLPSPAVVAQVGSVLRRIPLRPRRIGVAVPPTQSHGVAAWTGAWLTGVPVIDLHRLTPPETAALYAESGADAVTAVPDQLESWCAPTGLVISGSDRLAPAIAARLTDGGAQVVDVYGTTEAGPITLAGPAERALDPATVGRPLAGVRIRVVDGAGREVEPGALGRVEVCTPLLGRGRTLATDLGRMRDGLLRLEGRADELTSTRGELVSYERAEQYLRTRHGVTGVRTTAAGLHITADDTGLTADVLRRAMLRDLGPAYARVELCVTRRP